jgi:hypothetical protein
VTDDEGAESSVVRQHTSKVLHGTEQEIRLPLGPRKRCKEVKDVVVLGDSDCELPIERRDTPRLSIREASIPLGRIHGSTHSPQRIISS